MNEPGSGGDHAAVISPAPERPHVGRRELLGAMGLAGLGGALGLGFWLRDRGGMALGTDRARAAHLLRRAGFPPTAAEIETAMSEGTQATIERLLHPERVDDSALAARLADLDLTKIAGLRQWWMTRMAYSRRPLVEKVAFFWHGLLTSSYRKTPKQLDLMRVQNELFRTHGLGRVRDLLIAVSRDGAMLHWLDGTGSSKAHPNENYARELMELFTLGVGNYTETDVREAARALTGWYVDAGGTVGFRPKAHDDGVKTFLGRTGNLGLEEVVDTILGRPVTARYLSRRIWEFFAYPGVDDATLQPVVDAFHSTGGEVREVLRAVFTHPAFQSPRAYRALVKSPTELVVGVLRQHGLPVTAAAAGVGEGMGQVLFDPPNVAGWPPGAAWLTTGSWMARVRFLEAFGRQGDAGIRQALTAGGAGTVTALVDRASAYMVDGNLTAGARAAVVEHARGVPAEGAAADIVFLLAATPEYQLS